MSEPEQAIATGARKRDWDALDRVSRAWRCGMRALFVASVFVAGFSAGYYGARLHGH